MATLASLRTPPLAFEFMDRARDSHYAEELPLTGLPGPLQARFFWFANPVSLLNVI